MAPRTQCHCPEVWRFGGRLKIAKDYSRWHTFCGRVTVNLGPGWRGFTRSIGRQQINGLKLRGPEYLRAGQVGSRKASSIMVGACEEGSINQKGESTMKNLSIVLLVILALS